MVTDSLTTSVVWLPDGTVAMFSMCSWMMTSTRLFLTLSVSNEDKHVCLDAFIAERNSVISS